MCEECERLKAEIERLRRITSDEFLYKHFSRAFDVNRYDESFGGEFPSLDFFIHEVWKRNPKVAELQATIEVLVKALDEATADSRSIIVDKNGVVSRGRREMLHLSPASRAVAEKFLKDK